MSEVLVVGSLAYDSVRTPSGKADKSLGGSANYFSVAASLFAKVRVVGVVGEDYLDSDKKILLDRNVDLKGMQTVKGETFHWEGSYEKSLSDAITLKTELNVFAAFNPELPESYKDSRFVFLANIDPVLQLQVLSQAKEPLFVGMDTMNFWIDSKQKDLISVLKKVDIVFMNETEAKMLTQTRNPVTAVKRVAEMGPQYVVVKRGEYGSTLYSKTDGFFQVPALPIEDVIDPTGAGDSFAGGFFGLLASQCTARPTWIDLKRAVLAGTVLSSQTIQDFSLKALLRVDHINYENHLTQLKATISI
ncbi:MAG: sugar kinase [Bdellovibrionales bacterium RIFCSPHIGHO2_01_FULL_40_29]|nr:MAG: sugar kinase [Bdellovibrionales bacterium RIFCSPHIGHO2_01_FULL_40_29]OFZ35512.1 MAG: sugar kinase [Bdellovibrionales bacterium RIFCSPHIGHO2_02_FULL_40_15]